MENFMTAMEPVIQTLLALMLLAITLVFFHIYKIVKLFSKVATRLETLSDVKGWFDMFRHFGRRKKKKRKKVIYEDE